MRSIMMRRQLNMRRGRMMIVFETRVMTMILQARTFQSNLQWKEMTMVTLYQGDNLNYPQKDTQSVYTNARSAQYARDKLHGFEYPPGERLIVKLDTGPGSEAWPPPPGPPLQYNMGGEAGVAQAMNNLQLNAPPAAPAAPSYIYDPAYCSIALPPPQPLSHPDCPVVERLFLVCSPAQPPVYVVK